MSNNYSFIEIWQLDQLSNWGYTCDDCNKVLSHEHTEKYLKFTSQNWNKRLCIDCSFKLSENLIKLLDRVYG